MSKKTKATTDTMFREITAKQIQTMGARPEGVTMAGESGTASLSRDALQAVINRLHAERGALVSTARAVRMGKGVTSPEFAAAWFEVERVTRNLEEAESELLKLDVERAKQDAAESRAEAAAAQALTLCYSIERLPASPMQTACSVIAAELQGKLQQMARDLEDEKSREAAEPDKENAPLKRATSAAMDLCAMIGKLSVDDAVKAVEVLKCGMRVQLLALEQRKAVSNG